MRVYMEGLQLSIDSILQLLGFMTPVIVLYAVYVLIRVSIDMIRRDKKE